MNKAILFLCAAVFASIATAADNVKIVSAAAPGAVATTTVTNVVDVAPVAGNVKLFFQATPTGTNAVHITLECAGGVAWTNSFCNAFYTLTTNAPCAFVEFPAASLNRGNKIVILSNSNASTPFAACAGYTPKR